MKLTVFALTALLVAGCADGRVTPAETALTGCDAFASALTVLSTMNTQGKLSDSKVALVDKTKAYVDPFCLGAAPDVDASAIDLTVNAGVSVLQSIIMGN